MQFVEVFGSRHAHSIAWIFVFSVTFGMIRFGQISKNLPQNLTTEAPKRAVPSVLSTIIRSDFVRFCENKSKGFWHEKTPETLNFQGFSHLAWSRLTLAELRRTTGCFEARLIGNDYHFPLILCGIWSLSLRVPLTRNSIAVFLRYLGSWIIRGFQCILHDCG